MVRQQARSHVLAQPLWRLLIDDGEDGGEGVDERAVIFLSHDDSSEGLPKGP